MKIIRKLLVNHKQLVIILLILIIPNGLINTSHADLTSSKLNDTSNQITNDTSNMPAPIDSNPNRISIDNMPVPNPKIVGLATGKGIDFTYSFFDPILQNTINVLVINGTSFHIDVLQTLDMHNNKIINGVVLQQAQNQKSDLDAITNIPIPDHQCTTYFNTGDNTFRYVCNSNGTPHLLMKG